MAIIRSLAIGKAIKSAGNLTYSTIEGRTIAREKPAFVKNPRTSAQVAQRTRMSTAVALYRWLGSAVKQYFTVRKKYASQYNEFISRNIHLMSPQIEVNEDGSVAAPVGTCVASGVYPSAAVTPWWGTESQMDVEINNEALLSEVKEGDQLVIVGVSTDGSYHVDAHTLSAEDVEDLQGPDMLRIPIGSAMARRAIIWYSPSTGRSSTAYLALAN